MKYLHMVILIPNNTHPLKVYFERGSLMCTQFEYLFLSVDENYLR